MAAYDTVSAYLTDVRTLLQDTVQPYRYDDPSLLTALNATMIETRRMRADLFIGFLDEIPEFITEGADDTTTNDQYVPIEQPFRLAIVNGICGHALGRDQEDIQDARATIFMGTFRFMLTGSVTGSPNLGGAK